MIFLSHLEELCLNSDALLYLYLKNNTKIPKNLENDVWKTGSSIRMQKSHF